MISIQCPLCKKIYSVPESVFESVLGDEIRCKDCQHMFVITHDAGLEEVAPAPNLPPPLPQKPVAVQSSRKSIRYRCPRCKSQLESSGHLSGKSDVCPECGTTVTVPVRKKPKWVLPVGLIAGVLVIGVAAFVILSRGSCDSASPMAHELIGTATQNPTAAANPRKVPPKALLPAAPGLVADGGTGLPAAPGLVADGGTGARSTARPETEFSGTRSSIVGKWIGKSPEGEKVTYLFMEDNTVLWTVDSPSSPGSVSAKYVFDNSTTPAKLDIFEFNADPMKQFIFLGIVRFNGKDKMLLFGRPAKVGAQKGARPSEFTQEAIEFVLASDPVRD